MCIKVDQILRFFEPEIKRGMHWSSLPLSFQVEAINRLYNENKKFYDDRSISLGLCELLVHDCKTQYEFLSWRLRNEPDRVDE